MKPRLNKVVFSIPFHAQGYLTKIQNRRFAASKITEMLKKKKKKHFPAFSVYSQYSLALFLRGLPREIHLIFFSFDKKR